MPTRMQLCWAGCPGGFRGTAFYARFTRLIVSRTRGAYASPRHLGERNGTSTAPKLSKTSAVSTPHPWHLCHFEGTDRRFALCTVFPHSDSYALFDCLQGFGAFGPGLPSLLPTLLAIPDRLSRVHSGELQQEAVGGVFLNVPATLCGSLVVIWGRSGSSISPVERASSLRGLSLVPAAHRCRLTSGHRRQGMSGASFPVGRCTLLVNHQGISQPSPASWRLASSSQDLSGPCYSHQRVVHDA